MRVLRPASRQGNKFRMTIKILNLESKILNLYAIINSMAKIAVIKTGGKQYLVKENDEIVVDKLPDAKGEVALETLAVFDTEGMNLDLGNPAVKSTTKAQVVEHGHGDKIRIARFKSKVRYRKLKGFRADLTKLKILSI